MMMIMLMKKMICFSGNKLGIKVAKKKRYLEKMFSSMNLIGQKGLGFLKTGLKDIVDLGGSSLEKS